MVWGETAAHRRVGDDCEDGAPMAGRVLVEEYPAEPSGAEFGRVQAGDVTRRDEGLP